MCALAALVLVGLVALAVGLGVRAAHYSRRDDARGAALAAARREALNLTTIDYRTAIRDLDRIIAGASGALRAQFLAQRAQFPTVLQQNRSVSRGDVLTAGLVSLSGSQAAAAVAVDADVTNAADATAGGQTVVKHYRMVMRLQRYGSAWLVTDVAFAGLPQ